VWVTGASSGIGAALAEEFARQGDTVVISARSKAALRRIVQGLRREGYACHALPCDVQRPQEVEQVAQTILRRFRRIDILVNNAGVTSFKQFQTTRVEEFDHVLDVNLRSLFVASRAVLPSMLKRRKGSVINILSYAAKTTYTKSAAYSAAKAGAEALMNVLRAETRSRGIKVLNVYPGAVETSMWSPSMRRRYRSRMMQASDLARLIYVLTTQPDSMHVEELVVRPQAGDLIV
jgi:NADP-dependent 3-hydroxy acid dehydrogenase YdfG